MGFMKKFKRNKKELDFQKNLFKKRDFDSLSDSSKKSSVDSFNSSYISSNSSSDQSSSANSPSIDPFFNDSYELFDSRVKKLGSGVSKVNGAIRDLSDKLSAFERLPDKKDYSRNTPSSGSFFSGKKSSDKDFFDSQKNFFFLIEKNYFSLQEEILKIKSSIGDLDHYYSDVKNQAEESGSSEMLNHINSLSPKIVSLKDYFSSEEKRFSSFSSGPFADNFFSLLKGGYDVSFKKKRNGFSRLLFKTAIPAIILGSIAGGYFAGSKDYLKSFSEPIALEERIEKKDFLGSIPKKEDLRESEFANNNPKKNNSRDENVLNSYNPNLIGVEDYPSADDFFNKGVVSAGGVPILMYHKIDRAEDRFTVSPERFKSHLEKLYNNGFRTVSLRELKDNDFSRLNSGTKPVVITFDDADKGQFDYLMINGKPVYDSDGNILIDSNCAVAIVDEFSKNYPDFGRNLAFAVDFSDANHNYQAPFLQEEFVKQKLQYLVKQGYEIMNHTFSHIDVDKVSFSRMKEDILRAKNSLEFYIGDSAKGMNVFVFPYGSKPSDPEKMAFIDKHFDMRLDAWGMLAKKNDYSSGKNVSRIETNDNLDSLVIRNRSVSVRDGDLTK
jgi:peptidoglycan/xylan/chitin deacetylase (PgdA/CDA1 family)